MSSSGQPPERTADSRRVSVKILSQLPSPWAIIRIPDVPITVTVADLKQRIHHVVDSKPPISSQRLIYRGRFLARDSESLQSIFGTDHLRDDEDHVVHLVIRDQQDHTPQQPMSRIPTPTPVPGITPRRGAPAPRSLSGRGQQQAAPPGPNAVFAAHPQPDNHWLPQVLVAQAPHMAPIQPWGPLAPVPNIYAPPFDMNRQHPPPQAVPQQIEALENDIQTVVHGMRNEIQNVHDQFNARLEELRVRQAHNNQDRTGDTSLSAAVSATSHANGATTRLEGSGTSTVGMDQSSATPSANHTPNEAQNTTIAAPSSSTDGTMSSGSGSFEAPQPSRDQIAVRSSLASPNGGWNFPSDTTSAAPSNPTQDTQSQMSAADATNDNARSVPVNRRPSETGSYTWAGPNHAINVLSTIQATFRRDAAELWSTISLVDNRQIPVEMGRAIVRRLRDALAATINQRNAIQQAVNQVLTGGALQGTPPAPNPTEAQALRNLNATFLESVRIFQAEDLRYQIAFRSRSAPPQPPSFGAPTAQNTPAPSQSLSSVTAYLLFGPQGPSAVVYTPQAGYQSRGYSPYIMHQPPYTHTSIAYRPMQPFPHMPQRPVAIAHPAFPAPPTSTQVPHAAGPTATPAPGADEVGGLPQPERLHDLQARMAAHRAQIQELTAVAQRHRDNEAELDQLQDTLRQLADDIPDDDVPPHLENVVAINLTPLFQALWLFIRVWGIMWLFLGGTGATWYNWRMMVLTGVTLLYWAVQAGVVRQEWIDTARGYWESIIGIPPQVPVGNANAQLGPQPPTAGVGTGPQAQPGPNLPRYANADDHRANAGPRTPYESMREFVRPAERTLALFLASLYPGVGERHVAEQERQQREETARVRALAEQETERARQHEQGASTTPEIDRSLQASTPPAVAQQADGRDSQTSEENRPATEDGGAAGKLSVGDHVGAEASDAQGSSSSVSVAETSDGLTERRTTRQKDNNQ